MNVIVENSQTDLTIEPSSVEKLVKESLSFEGILCDEVAVHFVSVEEICQLHGEYFDDPTPTDCISFPMDDETPSEYDLLGDIFVCPHVAKEYAATHALNAHEELSLYIIHGLLHLIGYDDIEDLDREEMRAAEQRHLHHLKNLDLLLHI